MSDERRPWWYSGDAEPPPEAAPAQDAGSGRDWIGFLAGAARVVDWATETVMAPHAEHRDPSEHPDCLVCRAIALVGDSSRPGPRAASDGRPAPEVRWLPIEDEVHGD